MIHGIDPRTRAQAEIDALDAIVRPLAKEACQITRDLTA